jgi:Family of unknown function (DUF6491)
MNTLRTLSVATLAALSLVPISISLAASTPVAPQASIPFVNHGGIWNWEADHDQGLWVQDIHRKWYYTSFMGPCMGLGLTTRIGFDARPLDTFDRWSAIVVPGWGRCVVQSFTPSDGPPTKRKANPPRTE